MSLLSDRVFNFSAGPSTLPVEVLEQARDDLLNYKGTGMSVMEMSHRSKAFDEIITSAEAHFRELLHVPSNYRVLFFQGGGIGQFASTFLNMMAAKRTRDLQRKLAAEGRAAELKCDYIVTGSWSESAAQECRQLGGNVHVVATSQPEQYSCIPDPATWSFSPPDETAYVYYCDNETIHGVEFGPETVYSRVDPSVPIVCDMSSNILSRPVDVSKFGIIVAGAQKNMGPAGITLVIVREDLLERVPGDEEPLRKLPTVFDYYKFAKARSLLHTPPTYSLYICGLVFKWILDQGGVEEMERRRRAKALLIYDTVDRHPDFYRGLVKKHDRSLINPVFTLPNEDLTSKFLERAGELGMVQLKGHRSLGGIRPSLYNAMPLEGVQKLAQFMEEFYQLHCKQD